MEILQFNILKLSHAKDNVEVISDLKIDLIGGHSFYLEFEIFWALNAGSWTSIFDKIFSDFKSCGRNAQPKLHGIAERKKTSSMTKSKISFLSMQVSLIFRLQHNFFDKVANFLSMSSRVLFLEHYQILSRRRVLTWLGTTKLYTVSTLFFTSCPKTLS